MPDLDVKFKSQKDIIDEKIKNELKKKIKADKNDEEAEDPPKYIFPKKYIEIPAYYKWDTANTFCKKITGRNLETKIDINKGEMIFINDDEDNEINITNKTVNNINNKEDKQKTNTKDNTVDNKNDVTNNDSTLDNKDITSDANTKDDNDNTADNTANNNNTSDKENVKDDNASDDENVSD